ncbi:BRCA1 protein, partial [Heliornis fulica]|nr:BRCA1 protein [Heliornis fulica]
MDFSMIAVGDVQNVLSAMQKNLECPICLEMVKEPVSTKCDHIFCRFCMFNLLSKKKKGVTECPLCKTEVTKRSLKENSRFKQLIEGLLETIHAFELDTGVKFLNSHHFTKTPPEVTAAEFSSKENSVIQSRGFRKREKSARENEQENCTLEANLDTQLTDTKVRRCSRRNKIQKRRPEKGIYIELGSDSSEELFKQANSTGLEDKEVLPISSLKKLEEPKSTEKQNEYSCSTQPDKLGAKEVIPPKVIGERAFSEESLSKKSPQSVTEYAKPGQVNVTESLSSPSDVPAVDLLAEQCDRIGNAGPVRSGDTPFFNDTEEMDAERNSKSKELDLKDSSESRLDKSKELTILQSMESVEACEPEDDSFSEKELLEKLPQTETPHCATTNQVSRKRLKRSIQKVNEWFSKSNKILSSGSSQDDSAGTTDVSDRDSSDKDSSISEKTDPMVESMKIAEVQGNKICLKQTADSIKDKIFGKTYKRERRSNPRVTLRDTLPITKKEDVTAEKGLNNSSHDRLKRKRKTARGLQPEDFIKKKDPEVDGCPQSVNRCLGETEKKRCDESSAGNESRLSENRDDKTLAGLAEGGGSIQKKAAEKVMGKQFDRELELSNCDEKSTKKRGSAAKRCRGSTRTMCALQLVDRNSVSPEPAEPQIDSYPSSQEPKTVVSEQTQVRCSRRLQLLSEEKAKETGKGVTKGAKKSESDHGGSVLGVKRNVLVHASECKDLSEPQSMLNCKPLTSKKGGGLEPNEMPTSLRNPSDTAETGKSLFDPTSQHSNCSSSAPDAGTQESKIVGSPLLQAPSVSVVHTASHPTEEVTESCTAFPQGSGHDQQNMPRDLTTEKLPVATNVSELTKEVEDSELDTQYLRNIFRNSKRLSFSLYPAPVKVCAVTDAASETSKASCADQAENKHSKYLKPGNLQEEKTTAESLSSVCEKEKLKNESACVSPVTSLAGTAECMHTQEHQGDVSAVANQGNLTPVRMDAGRTADKNRLQNGEQGNEMTVSSDISRENEVRRSRIKSSRSQSDHRNTENHGFVTADLNAVNKIHLSSEGNQEGKAKVVDDKPCFQTKSNGKRERKQVKGNEEQATQASSIGMPECLITETPNESPQENTDYIGLSETVDGLLCSDDDTEENSSFSETHRRDRSAVFVKRSDDALVKELPNSNVSSKPGSWGIQRSRRRARKLQSSDEESSEDEDLPCFKELIFGKSVRTPLQIDKQVTSVVESSVSPVTLPHIGSHDDNMQKMSEAAQSTGHGSPSQESECSVNLFSSQSNMSDESVDGAQDLKNPLIKIHASKQTSLGNESKENFPSFTGRLKRSKANSKNGCQEDPNTGANLASGYDSETSNVEDTCGPFSQEEILTTQQKNAMQKNLKKLQKEMAVLEAVLKQHGSQDSECVHKKLPPFSSEGILGMEQMGEERENADEQKSGMRPNSASVLSNLSENVARSTNNSSSSVKLLNPQTAEATNSSVVAQSANKRCTQERKSKRNTRLPVSALHSAAEKENATGPGAPSRKEMSLVASGLNQSEHLMVQKFARKTQSTLSNHITEGTTHVIMKTDKDFVCERTLKYFLGIAGGKWVVSYQWIIQSFKEGRILDEEDFEVRGDVINGRNHQGPKRARQSLTHKLFKGFEICCFGPFIDMTTEHLEWMVELCGASVVKQLHLFTHTTNSTAVVVVQPDAQSENTDYQAIQQKNNVAIVTREWVLDSVSSYKCQEFDAYLVS